MAQPDAIADFALPTSRGGIRLATLVLIRWVAILGQSVAIVFVHFGLGFSLPIGLCLATVGGSVLLNLALFLLFPSSTRLSDRDAALQLGFDILQLALLLFLTGGLENPFALLFLAPVTISASALSLMATAILGILAAAATTLLAFFHLPLPWDQPAISLPQLYQFGVLAALVLGTMFIGAYAYQIAAETRRMSDALNATQLALAREQQLSALGGLAAAAAHELGTPLGTIAVVARELSREVAPDSALGQDVALLLSETARCRDILKRLAQRPESGSSADVLALPLPTLFRSIAERYQPGGVALEISTAGEGEAPAMSRSPELVHAIGNIAENAFDFASSRVSILIRWDDSEVAAVLADDGPGFNVEILSALGEPYVTSRPDEDGMGLGIFIAKTLLEHTGAKVQFANRAEGGAEARITWPRARIDKGRAVQSSGAMPDGSKTE